MWRILDACVGNPLYARELVLGAVEERRLVRRGGLWQLAGWPALTPSLTALITRRTTTLDPALRRPLELLALGEPLRIGELAHLSSYEAMEVCEVRGLLVVEGPAADAAVRLAHPLYGEVIRTELPVLRGRALRLALAETIQARRPLTPDDALRAARWLLDAGAELPPSLLLDAADAANLAGDPALAESLARRAVEDGASLRAVLALARAHVIRNRFAEAEETLAGSEPAAAAAARDGDPDASAYVSQRLYVLLWGLQRPEAAQALFERAAQWSDDAEWAVMVAPWQASIPGSEPDPVRALERIRRARDQPELSPDAIRSLQRAEGMVLVAAGRAREASVIARQLRPRPPLRDESDTYDLGLVYLTGAAAGEEWPELCEYMRQTLRAGIRVTDHQAAGFAAAFLGELAIHGGRYREATRWLAEAETHLVHHDAFGTLSCIRGLQAGIACLTGAPGEAQAAVESMRRRIAARPPSPPQMISLLCGEGWAARARGDAEGAEEFTRLSHGARDPNVRARLLHEALLCGARPASVTPALVRLAADTDCALIEAYAGHASAMAAHDTPALLAAAERLAAIGCVAAAVQAAAGAARTFADEGRQDSARRAAARMQELHPAGEGWEPPVIDGLDGVAVGLTPREAQIAALAARGLSNQQIADEIVLSVRTVETYVYRAMRKRGADNRRDL
jgi:DNA-binding NarL/FixJ family response regulator